MIPTEVTSPPQWSLALGMAGRGMVWLAVAAFVLAALAWLFAPKHKTLGRVGAWSFGIGCLSVLGSFSVLASLFATMRLEFEYVWGHSDPSYQMAYRLAGVWSGQQGSFLLWASCASVFGLLSIRGTGQLRRWYTVFYSLFLGTIASILAFESPYNLVMSAGLPVVPQEGAGMSPALLNYWMTIHPPVMFMGFGALTVLAAYGFAAMAANKLQEWVPMVRPWAILATMCTGLGLCMGGFWAYETLGWGGFWMWDPVENVSFVPWMMSAALIHGLIVQVTRKQWVVSNLLLAGLPMLLFIYGTFLTRSGVLSETSVHSFAEMDSTALKLLMGLMGIFTIGYLSLWVYRAIQYKRTAPQPDVMVAKGVSREGFYRLGVLMLVLMSLLAALGMSVPLFMSLVGKKAQIVEEPLYHRTLVWIYVPLMFALAVAPMASWRGMKIKDMFNRSYGVLCVTLVLVGMAMMAAAGTPMIRGIGPEAAVTLPGGLKVGAVHWVLFLISLTVLALVSNVWRMIETKKGAKLAWGSFLTHISIAVLMAGLIVSRGLERKEQLFIQENGHNGAMGYMITYKGQTKDLNDRDNEIKLEMVKGDEKWTATPGFYYAKTLDGRENPVSWPHIERYPFHDIYVALHPRVVDASEAVQMKPGDSVQMDRFKVTHLGDTRDGHAGAVGAHFGAKVKVEEGHTSAIVNPHIELGPEGMVEHPAQIGKQFTLNMTSVDAATGAVTLQLKYARPLYPVEVFYKPLTGLIWFGAGLMLVAGLMAAAYRWQRPAKKGEEVKENVQAEERLAALVS